MSLSQRERMKLGGLLHRIMTKAERSRTSVENIADVIAAMARSTKFELNVHDVNLPPDPAEQWIGNGPP